MKPESHREGLPAALWSSRYTTTVPVGETQIFIIHGYTGAMDVVSRNIGNLLSGGEELSQALRSVPLDVIERLLMRGYLVSMAPDEEHRYFQTIATGMHNVASRRAVNSFWVIPTYRCNLRCGYCFQDHALHRNVDEHGVMNEETIDLLFLALDSLGGAMPLKSRTTPRYITLFGGEPLMEPTFGPVRRLARIARDKGYKIGAISNGLDLDRFKSLLGPDQIRWLQITVDGLHQSHDRRRPLPCGGPNFEKVCENISTALECGVSVVVRTNVDSALADNLHEMQAFFEQSGWTASNKFRWCTVPVESHVNKAVRSKAISPFVIYQLAEQQGLSRASLPYKNGVVSSLLGLRETPLSKFIQTSACGSHTGMFFFDSHHNVYACSEQAGIPEKAVGTFGPDGLHLKVDKVQPWLQRHVGSVPECSQCSYALFCGGGCANAALQSNGTMLSPRCFSFQQVFQQAALQVFNTLRESDGVSSLQSDGYSVVSYSSDDSVRSGLDAMEYVLTYERDLSALSEA